jgi:hypothetical protein
VEEALANWNELDGSVKYENADGFLILMLRTREQDRLIEAAMG